MEQFILELKDVSAAFGGLVAVNKVSFSVPKGSIVAIIGPNGAGKTTLLNLICGLLPLSEGEIWFKQRRLDGLAPHSIASQGIARTFQNMQLFANMSVIENVMVGRHLRSKSGFLSTGLHLPPARAEERDIFEAAIKMLALVGLEEKAFYAPQSLSFGQQKLLVLARALATEPDLLLLDEPAEGLRAQEMEELGQWILRIKKNGVTILVVEHLVNMVMSIADRMVVLNWGKKIAEGTPAEIQNEKEVITAYLGRDIEWR